ncbi:MAG: peptidase inhibitor family I36 protein [Acidobacteria bacterium]|nr:peptidase inhibitor family I36 protein [Acidobacteriota bacterium]
MERALSKSILWAAAAALLAGQAAPGADQFRARQARGWDERASEGRCAIKVWVDDEVNIFLEGDLVTFETVRGQRARDAGTECTQPLPRGAALADFQFKGIDGRGQVDLIEAPERRNNYRAWVRIRDPKGGGEEHHFRLSWRQNWTSYGSQRQERIPERATRDTRQEGDSVCFYRDRDFRGESYCARAGDDVANVGPQWNDRFRSVRFFGRARSVEVYQDEGYRGASERILRDEPDLSRVVRNGANFDRSITSLRVR